MDIEIVVIGTSSRWVLSQPRIRIGRDPQCEVVLTGKQYSMLTGEPVTLEVVNGAVRLGSLGSVHGGTYLNDNPAAAGFVVRSGDILRLGIEGPELRICMTERAPCAPPAGYEPTRVLDEPVQAAYETTRVQYEPTRVFSSPAETTISPAPLPPPATPGRYGYGTEAGQGAAAVPTAAQPRAASAASPRRPDAPTHAGATPEGARVKGNRGQDIWVRTAPPAPVVHADDIESLHILEGKLKGMQMILWANLAVLAVLLLLVFQLRQQLQQNRQELRELRAQAQSAVGQLTPSLDARLNVFEQRMDGIDTKMRGAEEQMASGMDAKMKQAEDRMVTRMNAEIPFMLDKYISRKLAEVKH